MPFGQPLVAGDKPSLGFDMSSILRPQGSDPYAPFRVGSVDVPQHPMAAAVAKPKISWLGVLADALSGAAGQTPLYTHNLMLQKQQALEDTRYEHRQQTELERQKSLYLWEQQNKPKEPTEYERALQAAGVQPGTPDYAARINTHLNAIDDPVVTVTLPGNRVYSGPKSGLAAALSGGGSNPDSTPATEDGFSYTPGPGGRGNQANWKPIGGQTPRASGGFR